MALTVGENSYINYAEADAYMACRLHTAPWDEAGPLDCEKALMMASRRVDYLPFAGEKADVEQQLQFPRKNSDIPQAVKDAVCEEALEIIKGPDRRAGLRAAGVKSFRIGSLSEDLGGGAGFGLASVEARALLAPYMGVAQID